MGIMSRIMAIKFHSISKMLKNCSNVNLEKGGTNDKQRIKNTAFRNNS